MYGIDVMVPEKKEPRRRMNDDDICLFVKHETCDLCTWHYAVGKTLLPFGHFANPEILKDHRLLGNIQKNLLDLYIECKEHLSPLMPRKYLQIQ
jgi:hypothetical protein